MEWTGYPRRRNALVTFFEGCVWFGFFFGEETKARPRFSLVSLLAKQAIQDFGADVAATAVVWDLNEREHPCLEAWPEGVQRNVPVEGRRVRTGGRLW